MLIPPRARVGLVVVTVALVPAGCGGDDATPAGPSPSSTSSHGSPAPTTSPAPTDSPTDGMSSSSTTAGTAGRTDASDPAVEVTPVADRPQSAAGVRAGTAAVDAGAVATRMRIPAVGLSTRIESQGLRDGKVNPAPGQVIWFTGYDRVRPGAVGTTVIAGHVISDGRADAFAALERLSTGDGIVLDYPDGQHLRFEVISTDVVGKDALTTNRNLWGTNTDTRRVVLVTCDDELGFRSDGHRRANFVAIAELPA